MRACGPRHDLGCTMMGRSADEAVCMSLHCRECGREISMTGCEKCRRQHLIFAKLYKADDLLRRSGRMNSIDNPSFEVGVDWGSEAPTIAIAWECHGFGS